MAYGGKSQIGNYFLYVYNGLDKVNAINALTAVDFLHIAFSDASIFILKKDFLIQINVVITTDQSGSAGTAFINLKNALLRT